MQLTKLSFVIFTYHSNWNIILFVIIACSIVSATIFMERLFFLKKTEVDSNQFLLSIRKYIREGNLVAATNYCDEIGGSIGAIIKAGICRHHLSKDRIETGMEMAGRIEISRLEKNAKILSIIAYIAPLIGLLGTVLGFMQAFAEMRMSGLVDISATRIGEAMEYALVTTAAGLVVAIPSVLAYNYVVSRIENLVLDMQVTSSEVIELLTENSTP